MARRVKGLDFNVLADGESFAMAGCRGDLLAVLAANDGKRVALENLCVASGMVMVATCL